MIFSYEHTFSTKQYPEPAYVKTFFFCRLVFLVNFTFPKAEVETSVLQHSPYPDFVRFSPCVSVVNEEENGQVLIRKPVVP